MNLRLLSAALVLSASVLHAGGFGGPPPFSNGSPLITGIDGTYQASARGKNLSGVFRFSYANQTQVAPASPVVTQGLLVDNQNDYVFFVEGITYRGLTQASITQSSVSGVFDNGAANVVNYDDGVGTGIETFMSGYFNGKISLDSSDAFFEGDGVVVAIVETTESTTSQVAGTGEFDMPFPEFRAAVNQLMNIIPGLTAADAAALIGVPTWIPAEFETTSDDVFVPAAEVDFKFTGVRLNTSASSTDT